MDGRARSPGPSRRRTTHRRAFWLAARRAAGRVEVLAAELAGHRAALPVFSFEEEARLFLLLGGFYDARPTPDPARDGWRVRETPVDELVSLLLGPLRGVERVALDPLPGAGAGPVNRLVSLDRESFLGVLTDRDDADRDDGTGGRGVRRRP